MAVITTPEGAADLMVKGLESVFRDKIKNRLMEVFKEEVDGIARDLAEKAAMRVAMANDCAREQVNMDIRVEVKS